MVFICLLYCFGVLIIVLFVYCLFIAPFDLFWRYIMSICVLGCFGGLYLLVWMCGYCLFWYFCGIWLFGVYLWISCLLYSVFTWFDCCYCVLFILTLEVYCECIGVLCFVSSGLLVLNSVACVFVRYFRWFYDDGYCYLMIVFYCLGRLVLLSCFFVAWLILDLFNLLWDAFVVYLGFEIGLLMFVIRLIVLLVILCFFVFRFDCVSLCLCYFVVSLDFCVFWLYCYFNCFELFV